MTRESYNGYTITVCDSRLVIGVPEGGGMRRGLPILDHLFAEEVTPEEAVRVMRELIDSPDREDRKVGVLNFGD